MPPSRAISMFRKGVWCSNPLANIDGCKCTYPNRSPAAPDSRVEQKNFGFHFKCEVDLTFKQFYFSYCLSYLKEMQGTIHKSISSKGEVLGQKKWHFGAILPYVEFVPISSCTSCWLSDDWPKIYIHKEPKYLNCLLMFITIFSKCFDVKAYIVIKNGWTS